MELIAQPTNKSQSLNRGAAGVLCLFPPPSPWNAADWYGTPIAGTPFLLRNILTLQRSGIHDLIISLAIPEEDLTSLRRVIEKDWRVRSKIRWVAQPSALREILNNRAGRTPLFNGLALYNKNQATAHWNSPPGRENIGGATALAEVENLESVLQKIQAQGPAGLPTGLDEDEDHANDPVVAPDFLYIPGEARFEIKKPEDFKTRHEELLEASGLGVDSPITRILSRPFSRILTRLFLRTPITPNQITLFSFALGLISAACFFQGNYAMNVLGGLLLVFSTWVDGSDGEIARLKFMETEIGGKLDIFCDNAVHFFVFGAIGWGASRATGETVYLYLGAIAAVGSLAAFLILRSFLIEKKSPFQKKTNPSGSGKNLAEKLANRDFIHFLALTAVIDYLNVFISVTAAGVGVFVIYLLFSRFNEKERALQTEAGDSL